MKTYPFTHWEIYPGDKGYRLEVITEQQPLESRSYGNKEISIYYFSNQTDLFRYLSQHVPLSTT